MLTGTLELMPRTGGAGPRAPGGTPPARQEKLAGHGLYPWDPPDATIAAPGAFKAFARPR